MAGAFLSSAVIRMVTERVLANVIEQLPRSAGPGGAAAPAGAAPPQIAANSLAIQRLEEDSGDLKSSMDRVELRLDGLEHRLRWRTYLWIAITAIIVFAIGFGAALAIIAIG